MGTKTFVAYPAAAPARTGRHSPTQAYTTHPPSRPPCSTRVTTKGTKAGAKAPTAPKNKDQKATSAARKPASKLEKILRAVDVVKGGNEHAKILALEKRMGLTPEKRVVPKE